MFEPRLVASALVDEAMVNALIPWPCPCDLGPEGRYRLDEVIGIEPRSLVYSGVDRRLSSGEFEAKVAIKVVRRRGEGSREARALRRIVHPNVVRVFDVGQLDASTEYVVEELCPPRCLADVEVPIDARRAARIVASVALGVHVAHRAGVFHCDLKPANILIDLEDNVRVVDFGLANFGEDDGTPASRGNLGFMSPEQFRASPGALEGPADIYALGGLLYFLLTARIPNGDSVEAAKAALREGLILACEDLPPGLAGVVRAATRIAPSERYASADAMAQDLRRWLSNRPLPWTPPLARAALWCRRNAAACAIAATVVLAVGGAGVQSWRADRAALVREAAALAKGKQEAEVQLERTRAQMRSQLQSITASLMGISVSGRLADVAWLSWVYNLPVVGLSEEAGRLRVECLSAFVDEAKESGTLSTIEARLAARVLLVGLLERPGPLDLDRCDELFAVAQQMPASGGGVDSWQGAMTLIRHCLEARRAAEHGRVDESRRHLALAAAESKRLSPQDPLAQLATVVARICASGTPTTPAKRGES